MKSIVAAITIIGVMISLSPSSYASDWDKAGKALAIIEGARILTGGNVDIIGNIAGIGQNNRYGTGRNSRQHSQARNYSCSTKYSCSSQPVWVPNFVWKKKYVPEHEEYSEKYGTIIVGGHYIRYKVADGGHWE